MNNAPESLKKLCDEINENMEEMGLFVHMVNNDPHLSTLSRDQRWNGERMQKLSDFQAKHERLHNLLIETYGKNAVKKSRGIVVGRRAK